MDKVYSPAEIEQRLYGRGKRPAILRLARRRAATAS